MAAERTWFSGEAQSPGPQGPGILVPSTTFAVKDMARISCWVPALAALMKFGGPLFESRFCDFNRLLRKESGNVFDRDSWGGWIAILRAQDQLRGIRVATGCRACVAVESTPETSIFFL